MPAVRYILSIVNIKELKKTLFGNPDITFTFAEKLVTG